MRQQVYEPIHDDFRALCREFLAREAVPYHAEWEKAGLVDREVWRKAGAAGLLGFDVAEEHGGSGQNDFRFNAVLGEEIIRAGCSGLGFGLHNDVVAPYLIMVTAFMAQAILLEASLSFLGLGVTEPTPAWGLMLSGTSADFYQTAPWMILFPGLAITLAVFAFNLFGDSLRDWLDPKLKS